MKTTTIFSSFLLLLTCWLLAACSKKELQPIGTIPFSKNQLLIIPGTNMILKAVSEPEQVSQTKSGKETHYRIKFYPKDINEQQFLEGLKDVSISYVPFGYELVPDEENTLTSDYSTFPEQNPHKQILTGPFYSNDGFNKSRKEIQLPIMYAIWPIERELPQNIEYTIDSFLTMGGTPIENTRYPLRLQTYDSLLGAYVPLKNIKVRVSYSGGTAYQYTDNTGLVKINPDFATISSSQIPSVSIAVLTAGRTWNICPEDTSTPYQFTIGTIGTLWPTTASTITINMTSTKKQFEVYRAVEYYHSTANAFSSSVLSSETYPVIHICDQDSSAPGMQGETAPSTKTVLIYDVGLSQAEEIAVVLHELGHIRKWYHLGQTSQYDTDFWTHDSYACFLGAYLGEHYYLSNGFVKPYTDYLVNTMGQQHTWTKLSSDIYTPFYIDLFDSYNQSIYSNTLPDDVIQDVPASLVDNMGIASTSKSQSLSSLSNYVGVYYTLAQMNTFLSNY